MWTKTEAERRMIGLDNEDKFTIVESRRGTMKEKMQ